MVYPGVEGVGAVLDVERKVVDVQIAGADDLHWQGILYNPSVAHRDVEGLRGIVFIHTEQEDLKHNCFEMI